MKTYSKEFHTCKPSKSQTLNHGWFEKFVACWDNYDLKDVMVLKRY